MLPGIPGPVSSTQQRALPAARSARIEILPPSGLNLIALVNRLARTCIIRSQSKSARMDGSALSDTREIPFADATGPNVSIASATRAQRSWRLGVTASLPASMLVTSTRSPISRIMRAA